jgi:hypothetical protein
MASKQEDATNKRQPQKVNKGPLPMASKITEAIKEPTPAIIYLAKLLQAVTEAPFLRKQSTMYADNVTLGIIRAKPTGNYKVRYFFKHEK